MLYTGYDIFWWGRRLGHTDDVDTWGLSIKIGTTTYDIEIPDAVYTTIGGTPYQDLHAALQSALNSQAPGTWWVERVAMTGLDGTVRQSWGTRIRSTQTWTMVANVTSRAIRAALGYTGSTNRTSTGPGTGELNYIESPAPWALCWRTPHAAASKLSTIIHDQHVSGGHGQSTQLTRWGTDQIRTFRYTEIPAAHVRLGRAGIAAYAEVAGLPLNGDTNTYEGFWREAISTYQPIYALYNVGLGAAIPSYTSFPHRETLRSPVTSRYADELDTCLTRSRRSAEYYAVEFALRVETSTWGQG